ncbi:MAG: FHA domain-containing protein [Deltaproteobacteria bacterium]|nr:FHA domain-containing protein [Deltaproteobacteria bacterium]
MKAFRDFIKVVTTLRPEEFVEQFPHPVLIFSERPGAVESFAHTRLVESTAGSEHIDRFSEELMDFIVLLPNPKTGREFPRKSFIGRDEKRDFTIQHSTVSKRHACLLRDEGEGAYKLVDSGSTNGTCVRGRTLKPGEPVRLFDGDVITFGKVDFLFFSPEGAYRFMRQYRMFRQAMQR